MGVWEVRSMRVSEREGEDNIILLDSTPSETGCEKLSANILPSFLPVLGTALSSSLPGEAHLY